MLKNTPLRTIRNKQNKSLKEVSEHLKIDPSNLSRIERGLQEPSKSLAEEISKFFGGKISEIEIIYPERYQDA